MKAYQTKIALVILSLWLGMTATIDFSVLPMAFKTIPDMWLAGTLGMKLFSVFNPLEVIFSLGSLFCLYKVTKNKLTWSVAVSLVLIAAIYQFYLTEKISFLTKEIIKVKETSVELMAKLSLEHNFYHKIYVRLDSVKILLILLFIILLIRNNKEEIVA